MDVDNLYVVSVRSSLYICCWFCISASVAWSLHRNLGFPLDLIDLMLEERGKMVDKTEMKVLEDEYEKVTISWETMGLNP